MATYECERLAANRDHDKIIFDIKGDISFDIDVNGATIRTIKINKPYIPLVVRIPSFVQYNGRNYPVLSVEGFSYFPGKYEKITDKRKKDFDKWVFTGKYSDHKSPASIFHRYEEAGRYKAPCIVEVILPNTIQTIGDKAFSDLESLDIIHIPKETLSIGAEAFIFCRGLKTCTIPKSVKKLELVHLNSPS